ncbi:hypothetical protein PI124_g23129 [Phytophthora idaei]|nr:hypothetical protein PI124_g23129 [Phytophthora idaei]
MKYYIASQSLSKNEEQSEPLSERVPGQLGTSPASRYVVLQQSPPSFRLLFSFPLAFSLLRASQEPPSKSRSPVRRRRSTSRSTSRRVKEGTKEEPKPQVEQQEEETNTLSHLSEEEQMKLLLGIGGFDSTKGKAVEENLKSAAVGTARRETKREYRQYMNRRGGFNRPLDKL